MRQRLIGVRHDGRGRYPLQTYYCDDPGVEMALAEALDPGHVVGVYEYSPDDSGAWYATPARAAASERFSRQAGRSSRRGE